MAVHKVLYGVALNMHAQLLMVSCSGFGLPMHAQLLRLFVTTTLLQRDAIVGHGFLLWVRIASACPTIASLCNK